MQYVNLGSTGLQVSRLALGMLSFGSSSWRPWVLNEEASRNVVRHAIERGINFFDTANLYSAGESEILTGKFVREYSRREEVVVATKVYHPVALDYDASKPVRQPNAGGLSRKHLFHAIDESLRRLQTDYVDLWQIHRHDPLTPIEETLEALHDIVRSGKVRYIGASSMFAWQFAKAQYTARARCWTPFVSMQGHYNLAYREEEREMIPLCRELGVAVIPYSPLARGFLAGNRAGGSASPTLRAQTDGVAERYYSDEGSRDVLNALTECAGSRGVSNATMAYSWLLHQGAMPIIGASKTTHIDQAVAALDLSLDAAECRALETPYRPRPVIGHS